jgi:hypothetical protein
MKFCQDYWTVPVMFSSVILVRYCICHASLCSLSMIVSGFLTETKYILCTSRFLTSF